MHRAAAGGVADVVQTLIEARCDPSVVDERERNVVQMAAQSGKKWIAKMLEKKFPALEATTGKGRKAEDKTSGLFRHEAEAQMEHPQKGKKSGGKRGYQPADQTGSSASDSQGKAGKYQRIHSGKGRKGRKPTTT